MRTGADCGCCHVGRSLWPCKARLKPSVYNLPFTQYSGPTHTQSHTHTHTHTHTHPYTHTHTHTRTTTPTVHTVKCANTLHGIATVHRSLPAVMDGCLLETERGLSWVIHSRSVLPLWHDVLSLSLCLSLSLSLSFSLSLSV